MNQEGDIYNVADETYNDSVAKVETEFQERPTGEIIQVTTTTWSSPNSKLDGQRFKIDGQIGLQLVIRFLFFNFEQILYSYSFNLMDETTGDWDTIQTNWTKNKEAQYSAISSLLGKKALTVTNMGGQQKFSLNLAPTVESRDYLAEGSAWKSNVGLSAWEDGSGPEALHYNTYPYANPVITGDGKILAYLADQGSENVEDTRAFFTVHNGSAFREGIAIDDGEGYGDSQIALSGNGQFAAVAWTRQMESIQKDAGAVLTTEDQLIMMNSAEIYAAVYNGTDWATVRLTENSTADLAPVTASNGSRAIVAWRSVASSGVQSGDYADMTNFDEKDTILYRVYDGAQWSQIQTLYNGTSGAIKGLTAAMLADGTAAVAYSLDPDSEDTTITDREIWYAVVDNSGEVSRSVRATNDADLDENPQLTAVTFPGADNEEGFVLGWYAEHSADGGEPIADIRLLDFNSSGRYTQLLPDSVNQAAYTASITPTFRFAKNASTINDLSILWAERNEDLEREVEKDVLKAVKFYTYGQNRDLIRFTGVIDVGEMGDGTVIDHFDAHVTDTAGEQIQAVLLGTTYGADGVVTRIGTTIGDETVQYAVPSRTTSMYMAAATYGNTIEITNLTADYETIRKGAKSEILFTIENKGIDAVKSLTINLTGGHTTTYSDLNLLPGTSIQLYADYVVPTDRVVNPDYTVQAVFDQGETHAVGDKIYLNIPDLAITDASIIREENGERTILIKLNNGTDADLAGSGRTVNIGFYSDATCETPIEGLKPISVTSATDLAMIDEGGYSVSTVFDVKAHLKEADITEIPDSGIQIFLKAEVLENCEIVPELIESNNAESVVCENLRTRTGSEAILTSTLSNSDEGTIVSVHVQNTQLSEAATGNVIVTLLDQNGNAIAQKQSFDPEAEHNGLLTLGGEEKALVTFHFSGETARTAASVEVSYSDLVPQIVKPEIIGVEESYLWTGKPIHPAVQVLANGAALSPDDYEVIYGTNTDTGTGTVTVVLKGSYSGETTVTFTILALSPYDINKDGVVNLLDVTRAQRFYGLADSAADIDGNGTVGIEDLVLILNNFDEPFA